MQRMTSSHHTISAQNFRFVCNGCKSLSAHLLDLVHQNLVSADVGGLTSRLAAHLVQTAAGTDAAADDDEENDSNARKTKYHGQWGIREVIF